VAAATENRAIGSDESAKAAYRGHHAQCQLTSHGGTKPSASVRYVYPVPSFVLAVPPVNSRLILPPPARVPTPPASAVASSRRRVLTTRAV